MKTFKNCPWASWKVSLLLLLLSRFSRVWLCATPQTAAYQTSPIPRILQARILEWVEWVAISFSNAWKWKVKPKSLSRVWLLATPWTAAYQAPPSMGFSRQEYWSGVPLPSPKVSLPTLKYVISICICTGGQVHSSQEYRILNHDYIWINIK